MHGMHRRSHSFSALQRAEIAEMLRSRSESAATYCFSALQRAEIAEIERWCATAEIPVISFSALQRAEIAEIAVAGKHARPRGRSFSALQRAEIAEIYRQRGRRLYSSRFQCSSTSRNC